MANIVAVLVVLLLAWYISSILRRRSHGIVPERGLGVDADLGALADKPQVRVRSVTVVSPDRVRLVLTPDRGPVDGPGSTPSPDLDFVVYLDQGDTGFELLHGWQLSCTSLAIVLPPGGRMLRLRSTDGLQPISLRLVGSG